MIMLSTLIFFKKDMVYNKVSDGWPWAPNVGHAVLQNQTCVSQYTGIEFYFMSNLSTVRATSTRKAFKNHIIFINIFYKIYSLGQVI